jgi:heat shock protein HtpX
MYEDIRNNKIKTGVIVVGFLTMIALIIYFLCYAFDLSEYAMVIALIFSITSTIATYYNCDKVVLASVKARPATKEEDLQLTNILEGLMLTTGLTTKPRLYVVDSKQPNAFATGRDPEHAIICVTQGLLEKLNYYELEGVIAHELSHIKNYDIRLSAVISVMVGFIVLIADNFWRFSFGGSRRRNNRDNDNGGNAILMIIGAIFLILSPIFSKLIQLAVSRRREYLADATAVSFTRNPDGLISALEKISSDQEELDVASKSNEHMYIVTPFKGAKKSNLFSTHPDTQSRIEALRKLK